MRDNRNDMNVGQYFYVSVRVLSRVCSRDSCLSAVAVEVGVPSRGSKLHDRERRNDADFPALRNVCAASPWLPRHEYREFLAAANAPCATCACRLLHGVLTHNARLENAETRNNSSRINSPGDNVPLR